MVPDKFNMVSMGGIDVVESQGIAVAGLYQRLVESIALCRYSTLYNWKFAGINIPPTPVELVYENGVVTINEAISVDSNDVVHIESLQPVLEILVATENGVYLPSEGYIGFSRVNVEIPLGTKEITENGTYVASDDSLDGYSAVTVNVSSGGSGIDYTFLPNSIAANVLSSAGFELESYDNITMQNAILRGYTDLSAANTDVTCYAVIKKIGSGEVIPIAVSYALSNGNNPGFYFPESSTLAQATNYGSNTTISGIANNEYHVYAVSIDSTNKKAKFYVDAEYKTIMSFSNSGSYVVFGKGSKADTRYVADCAFGYFGVVAELESDETIIANQQTIMIKLGIGS